MRTVENWYFYSTEDFNLGNTPQEIANGKLWLQNTSYITILLFSMFENPL